MPYDHNLAKLIRSALLTHPGIVEKKMFGGGGSTLGGNMACGVQGNDLIVRVGAENNDEALSRPFVKPFMAMPGKPMAGWILVASEGISTEQDFQYWIKRGVKYASTLPEK